jgi:hypothetical protein
MNKVAWEDIEESANELFNIWTDNPEIKWAKKGWEILGNHGLTNYNDESEKQKVLINFLSLACIYHEFCFKAFRERTSIECNIIFWLEKLTETEGFYISLFRLGQFLHSDSSFNNSELYEYSDETDLLPSLLIEATTIQHKDVTKALLLGFGSIDELFLSLWNSNISDKSKITSIKELPLTAGEAYQYIEETFTLESDGAISLKKNFH